MEQDILIGSRFSFSNSFIELELVVLTGGVGSLITSGS